MAKKQRAAPAKKPQKRKSASRSSRMRNAAAPEAAMFRLGILTNQYRFHLCQFLVLSALGGSEHLAFIRTTDGQIRSSIAEIENLLRDCYPQRKNANAISDNWTTICDAQPVNTAMGSYLLHGRADSLSPIKSDWPAELASRVSELVSTVLQPIEEAVGIGPLAPFIVEPFDDSARRVTSADFEDKLSSMQRAYVIGRLFDQGLRPCNVAYFMSCKVKSNAHCRELDLASSFKSTITQSEGQPIKRVVSPGEVQPSTEWLSQLKHALRRYDWSRSIWDLLCEVGSETFDQPQFDPNASCVKKRRSLHATLEKLIVKKLSFPYSQQDEKRNAWIYRQWSKGLTYDGILRKLDDYRTRKHYSTWRAIKSPQGIRAAVLAYAIPRGLPTKRSSKGRKKRGSE